MDGARGGAGTDPTGQRLASFPAGGRAVVVGAGGIGTALAGELAASGAFGAVTLLSRRSDPPVDVTDEAKVAAAFARLAADPLPLRLVVVATGFLHDSAAGPEKSLGELDRERLMRAFLVNAIGPALVFKHAAPLIPREGKAVLAAISAKVGSIGDNAAGGWYGYRASKAALNQIVRTAAIELKRRRPDAILVALHPGTVATPLSAPFAKAGLDVRTPAAAARDLAGVIDRAVPADSGAFLDWRGARLPW